MIFALVTQIHVYLWWINARFLNVRAVVGGLIVKLKLCKGLVSSSSVLFIFIYTCTVVDRGLPARQPGGSGDQRRNVLFTVTPSPGRLVCDMRLPWTCRTTCTTSNTSSR